METIQAIESRKPFGGPFKWRHEITLSCGCAFIEYSNGARLGRGLKVGVTVACPGIWHVAKPE